MYRCLKPNDENVPEYFNRKRVTEQLRYGIYIHLYIYTYTSMLYHMYDIYKIFAVANMV